MLQITLSNIREKIVGAPTVLWTGNGYHIYQPIDIPQRFEDMEDFGEFDNLDNLFLRFEKDLLSNGYADKKNHPSLKSCLLRVPGSLNSKCLTNGLPEEESKVKIIQQWNGKRIPITYHIGIFYTYIVSERQKEEKRRALYTHRLGSREQREIPWIEKLLKTPMKDNRKLCLWHIMIPYLINIKGIPKSEVSLILEKWIKECDKIRKIDFDYKYTIKSDLKSVMDHKPISLENLRKEYPDLYELVCDS